MRENPAFSVTIVASDCESPRVIRWSRLLGAESLSVRLGVMGLRRALGRIRPDIVQVVGVPAEVVAAVAATLSGCPAVVGTAAQGPQDRLQRVVHRRFHRYVAESQGHARGFLRDNPHVHLGRVVVVERSFGEVDEADQRELEALTSIYRETLAMRTGRR